MKYERCFFGISSFAGCIFVAGGYYNDLERTVDKCEVYSTESCEWTEVSSMNTKRRACALIYFQDKLWVNGGMNTTYMETIEIYDLAENRWTINDTKLLSQRAQHGALVHNKKFFVIGGENKDGVLSSVEIYSSETNQFSFVSPMVQARSMFGCSIFNNKLIVFGRRLNVDTEIIDSFEIYDIEKQVWLKGPTLPRPLTAFGYATY